MTARKKEIEKAQERFDRARGRLQELLEQERNEVARPQLRQMLGKCFKFQNSYGGDSEKWWLYAKIIRFDERAMALTAIQFQLMAREGIRIEYERDYCFEGRSQFIRSSGNWMEISPEEYEKEARKARAFVNRLIGGRASVDVQETEA